MDDNGAPDNVAELKTGQNQKKSMIDTALEAVEKTRREAAQNKLKAKAATLLEQQKAIAITKAEMQQIVDDFNNGL